MNLGKAFTVFIIYFYSRSKDVKIHYYNISPTKLIKRFWPFERRKQLYNIV